MRTPQTSDLINDIDAWLSENISNDERLAQDLETLGRTRLPAGDMERMFRTLGDLRALQADPVCRPSLKTFIESFEPQTILFTQVRASECRRILP